MTSTRRIFLIWQGKLFLAPEAVPWTHLQFMINETIVSHERDPEFENVLRGYIIQGHITCYQGKGNKAPTGQDMRPAFLDLFATLNIPADTEVTFGVSKGEPGKPWHANNSLHRLELVKWRINPAIA